NGDSLSPVASASAGAEGPIPPKTVEQKLARKNKLKAQSTLMLSIPDEHLLKFHVCKELSRIGLEATRNQRRYRRAFSSIIMKSLLHQILSEDAKSEVDENIPSAWNNIALIMRNKSDLDTLSMDDLYNNLKVYESEIKGQTSSSSNSQNVAFVSSDNSNSTNKIVNTAHMIETMFSVASSKDQALLQSYI
ncbi:hypothetical protein Tco_0172526, partial [Tanacetum coccineum]